MVDGPVEAGGDEVRIAVPMLEVNVPEAIQPFRDDNSVGIEIREKAAVPPIDEIVPPQAEILVEEKLFMDADHKPDNRSHGEIEIANEIKRSRIVAPVIHDGNDCVVESAADKGCEAALDIVGAVPRHDHNPDLEAIPIRSLWFYDFDVAWIHRLFISSRSPKQPFFIFLFTNIKPKPEPKQQY